ncbi:hypothetical protein ACIBG7_15990 [Nonomuraea sp. NPDC050328]
MTAGASCPKYPLLWLGEEGSAGDSFTERYIAAVGTHRVHDRDLSAFPA